VEFSYQKKLSSQSYSLRNIAAMIAVGRPIKGWIASTAYTCPPDWSLSNGDEIKAKFVEHSRM